MPRRKNTADRSGSRPEAKPKRENLEDIDPFAYLFSEYDPDTYVVSLARLEPEEFQGHMIKGWLCKLSPGHDEEWIKKTFGGGHYILNLKNYSTGRIEKTRHLTIAGNPILPPEDSTGGPGPEELPFAPGPTGEPVMLDLGGTKVPWSGNMQQMQELVLFCKTVERLWPPSPDINETLLAIALGKNEQAKDALTVVRELKEAADLLTPPEAAGGNIYDLLGKVVDGTAAILRGGGVPRLRSPVIPPGRQIDRRDIGKLKERGKEVLKEKGPVNTGKTATTEAEELSSPEEIAVMSEKEILFAVVNQVVKAFRLMPPKDPKRVVPLLDQFLREKGVAERVGLVSRFKETVFDFAEVELESDFGDPDCPETNTREAFQEWFENLFTWYQSEEREVNVYE